MNNPRSHDDEMAAAWPLYPKVIYGRTIIYRIMKKRKNKKEIARHVNRKIYGHR